MGYFFNIGMTKNEVLSKLKNTNATKETKQLIQNFWKSDHDGKVTNEIELTMLEAWANGSTQVPMPTLFGGKPFRECEYKFGPSEIHQKMYVSGSQKDIPKSYDDLEAFDTLIVGTECSHFSDSLNVGCKSFVTWDSNLLENENIRDILKDNNMDGIADIRLYRREKLNNQRFVVEETSWHTKLN